MKTLRTVLFTLAAVLVSFGLFALIAVSMNLALVGRTLYQMFHSTYVIFLVVGVALLLIAIILTISLVAFKDDDNEDEEDEDEDEDNDANADDSDEDTTFQRNIRRTPVTAQRRETEPIPSLFAQDDEPQSKVGQFRRPMHMTPRAELEAEPQPEPIDQPKAEQQTAIETEPQPEAMFEPQPSEPVAKAYEPQIIRCIYCGEPIDKNATFCSNCGRRR
ncbi:MAG: zinc-ribbon domain-containing protein [Eubacteriales bacterium]|nr:zinc-ribbon domain-containing protein [Eubacteriales bacterium]